MDAAPPSSSSGPVLRSKATASLGDCPYCGCEFVQPVSWRELGSGSLRMKLRCPNCRTAMSGVFEPARVIDFDESLVEGRTELVDCYERLLRENLAAEADRLASALALDLIGPDDFSHS